MSILTLVLFAIAALFGLLLGTGELAAGLDSAVMIIAFILVVISAISGGSQHAKPV